MVRHKNYEILNLIGYGLAKFDMSFVQEFGFQVKQRFFEYIVEVGVAETVGTVKNRQDVFEPFFAHNHRQGWRQRENKYIYREKVYFDSVLGSDNVQIYAKIVKLYLNKNFNAKIELFELISPKKHIYPNQALKFELDKRYFYGYCRHIIGHCVLPMAHYSTKNRLLNGNFLQSHVETCIRCQSSC